MHARKTGPNGRTGSQTRKNETGKGAFPIGFWNYCPAEMLDASAVKDWAEAGMTLTMSPDFGSDPAHEERIKAILDAAQERGIRIILCHRQGYWPHLTTAGEVLYRKNFAAALKTYGTHPAVFGFHVGDEPGVKEFADACRAMRIQKEMAPNLTPFCNLLPWHQGCEARIGSESWSAYLDDYVREARPDFLCYDCYSQMNPNPETEGGFEMYFRNLREYEEAGRRHGIPFWTTLLSVGHFRYRCPLEDHLRWQLNTALAHGAQGILYFFFYMRQPSDNYRVAPIDEHGERTERYEWLSRVNRTFLRWTAPVVKELRLRTVRHSGQVWGGVNRFDGSGRVSRAHSHHGTPLIVSEFTRTGGGEYVMVVNNSQTDSTQAEIWVRGRQPALSRVGWEAREVPVTGGDGWQAASGTDFVVVRPWLAPGQMELYRIADGNQDR